MEQEPTISSLAIQLAGLIQKVEGIDKKIDSHSAEMSKVFEIFITKENAQLEFKSRDDKISALEVKYNWIVGINVTFLGSIIALLIAFFRK